MESVRIVVVALVICGALSACKAEQCGSQANFALCGEGLCCSKWGWCGVGDPYCGEGCQAGPCGGGVGGGGEDDSGINDGGDDDTGIRDGGVGGGGEDDSGINDGGEDDSSIRDDDSGLGDVASIVSNSAFNRFLSRRTSAGCPANGFYTRSAFLSAASAYRGFGTTGSTTTRKRELAAFFANIAHESGSGCYKEEIARGLYCNRNLAPCAPGQQYYGRGPIQITWNYNYQAAGRAIGFNGINNPGIVASNPVISFKTAVWYWMTQHRPTCHRAIVSGQGFGATIKAINGGLECGPSGNKAQQQARITLYKSFCSILGVAPGGNLTC